MNSPILFGEHLVRLPSARIPRRDVAALRGAADLLSESQRIRDETGAATEAAREQGYQEGKQAAYDEFATALSDALRKLTADFAKENARRAEEVSEAAIEVVTQLIGRREPTELVAGLAAQALTKLGAGENECVVELAPDLVEPVRELLEGQLRPVRIEANEELGAFGCRVLSGEGQIIADLDTQLQTLRKRWGLDDKSRAEP